MTKFESSVKPIPYPVEDVYRNISDLRNLDKVRDRVPEDKLSDFAFDEDTVQVKVDPVGLLKRGRKVREVRDRTVTHALQPVDTGVTCHRDNE